MRYLYTILNLVSRTIVHAGRGMPNIYKPTSPPDKSLVAVLLRMVA
jgi:hypothetical protein